MENCSETTLDCTNSINEQIKIKQESCDSILLDTSLSEFTLSSYKSESEMSSCDVTNTDLFEGTIYKTISSESSISINFVSSVFFESFKNKIHADYMNSIDIDNTNFISKCTTHIKGAKCDIKLDTHFKTVELSGLGSKFWRNERFPQITRSLFKRIMYDLDSQMEGFSQCKPGTGDDTGIHDQLDTSSEKQTTDVNVAPKSDVAESGSPVPSRDVTLNSAAGADEQLNCVVNNINSVEKGASSTSLQTDYNQAAIDESNSEKRETPEFTAENITSVYLQSINAANGQGQGQGQGINPGQGAYTEKRDMKDKNREIERNNFDSNGLMICGFENREFPVLTSTPITANNGTASQTMRVILGKIDQLESGIKTIKRDILQQMESKLDTLKASVVCLIEQMGSNKNYADAARASSHNVGSLSSLHNNTDEGYGDLSTANIRSSSSETQLKTPFVPNISERSPARVALEKNKGTVNGPNPPPAVENNRQTQPMAVPSLFHGDAGSRRITTPQPVPVHITNRNRTQNNNRNTAALNQSTTTSSKPLQTLVVGDSVLKGINSKGLESGVRICSKNGAKIKDIWDEISVYDFKSFQNVIICVGGNDSSSGTETSMFEEKYDELVGYIKAANNNCAVYLCKVVPRGDVDVSGINASIERVVNHWRMHNIKLVESTNELFFGADGLPCGRYFSTDGIHVSHSGTKRFIDAINRHVLIVRDFQSCVYRTGSEQQQQQGRNNKRRPSMGRNYGRYKNTTPNGGMSRNTQFTGHSSKQNRTCYACSMPGHIYSECWFTQ